MCPEFVAKYLCTAVQEQTSGGTKLKQGWGGVRETHIVVDQLSS